MNLDICEFPVVRVRYESAPESAQSMDDVFTTFGALLDRATPFVLIATDAPADRPEKHPPELRRRMNAWMKQNRARLALCQSMIVVERSVLKRVTINAFSSAFGKYWGFPMTLVATLAEAEALAAQLLGVAKAR